jgi:aldose 1-epimerase
MSISTNYAAYDANADPKPFEITSISAPDGSITAKFIGIGATLAELWVKDKDGKLRDVVAGYDDPVR